MFLNVLSHKFHTGCPWEMLYADHLVILAETFEGLMTKMAVWKNVLESKGLKVNMGKAKVMISGRDLHTLQTSGKYLCAVCRKGVRKNSIFCSGCFGFNRKVLSQVHYLKILILCVGVLVMHGQLIKDLALKSNSLMESLM